MSLAHYIIVRRDLPLGVVASMITHASGESAALYQDPYDGRFRGATAVVLEAKNERSLNKTEDMLRTHAIPYVVVVESGGPYDGQLLAIGVVPIERSTVSDLFKNYQTLKELTCPTTSNATPAET